MAGFFFMRRGALRKLAALLHAPRTGRERWLFPARLRRPAQRGREAVIRCQVSISRACLKIHSWHLHAPLRGIFGPNSLNAARCAAFIWPKSPTKWHAQLPESNFQTRSGKTTAIPLDIIPYFVYNHLNDSQIKEIVNHRQSSALPAGLWQNYPTGGNKS